MNHLSRMLLVILLLAPAGCKKDPPPMAPVSPVANPPPAATDPDNTGTDPDTAATPPPDDKNDWRRQKPAAGSGSAAAKTAQPQATPPKTDEDPAAKAARLAKIATQRAADVALAAASKAMKDCYDRAKAPSATATISFRVRSTGYVSAPSVKGVESTVASCIEGVLRDLRVSGVQTAGLAIERTLRFTRR